MSRFARSAGWLSAGLVLAAACGGRSSGSGSSSPQDDRGGESPATTAEESARTSAAEQPPAGDPPAADDGSGGPSTGEDEGATSVAGLHLELRTPTTIYAAGEPLDFTAWLVNETAEPIAVLRRASHVDLGLDASNGNGEFITSLLPPEPPPPPTAADLATVDPGGELELVDWELLDRVNQQIAAGNGRTGRFLVAARYHAGSGLSENLRVLNPTAWVGSLRSNAVLIDVGE